MHSSWSLSAIVVLVDYEKGLQKNLNDDHTFICKAGAIYCDNIRNEMSVAIELDNGNARKFLKRKNRCRRLRYFLKNVNERAAMNYIRLKNWAKVGKIPYITSSKIHGICQSYRKENMNGKDFDSVIRLHLENLNNPEMAVEFVQKTKSVEGAKLVARLTSLLILRCSSLASDCIFLAPGIPGGDTEFSRLTSTTKC